jgi:hypothetical protein
MTRTTQQQPPARKPMWVLAASWLGGLQLVFAGWFWAVATAASVVGVTVMTLVADEPFSIVAFLETATIWAPFSFGIVMISTYLPVCVANGMPRRALARGALVVVAGTAVVYGAALTGALAIERLYFHLRSWSHIDSEEQALLDPWWGTLATHSARTGAALVCGVLVAIAYYRLGSGRGTLMLPLTMAPLAVVAWTVGDRATWFSDSPVDLAAGVRVLVVALALAAAAAAFRRLMRDVPIHPVGS